MSSDELLHRGVDAVRRRTWAHRQVTPGADVAAVRGTRPDRSFRSPLPSTARDAVDVDAAAAVVAAADRVLVGTWTTLGVERPDSADPDWFADPLTGRRAPDRQLAFRVQHRDESRTGNVKQVWELSRHHHLSVLATAWWLTEDERYAEAAAHQLRSWWAANPFLSGVHWTSGIEAGIRLLSWVWVRRLLHDWPKVGDLFEHNEEAVRQIGWHQEFLAAFPSRGSSANNHVIAEAAGRLAAACAFPWFSLSEGWRRDAAELLELELEANTFPDGLNREQATDYHRFVLELGLAAGAEADAAGRPLTDGTWGVLARMLDAAAAMVDSAGRPPRQGDGDEGRGVVLDDPDRGPWAAALDTGAALLAPASWWPEVPSSVQGVLLGALGTRRQHARPPLRPGHFPDAGLVLLRSAPHDGPEIWCRCDSGPHGFLSIAAHAHADALSVEVRSDGVDILADPGTYCYHGEPEWRAFFRSTAAHNTLAVGGADQSESGGPFLWVRHARSATRAVDVGDQPVQSWTAEHDGYRRLGTPATHRRSVTLDSPARRLTVSDVVDASSPLDVSLVWHLGPDVRVQLSGSDAVLSWLAGSRPRQARIVLPEGLIWTLRRGEVDPVQGWYSSRFGVRVPTTTLQGRGRVASAKPMVTQLEFQTAPDTATSSAEAGD